MWFFSITFLVFKTAWAVLIQWSLSLLVKRQNPFKVNNAKVIQNACCLKYHHSYRLKHAPCSNLWGIWFSAAWGLLWKKRTLWCSVSKYLWAAKAKDKPKSAHIFFKNLLWSDTLPMCGNTLKCNSRQSFFYCRLSGQKLEWFPPTVFAHCLDFQWVLSLGQEVKRNLPNKDIGMKKKKKPEEIPYFPKSVCVTLGNFVCHLICLQQGHRQRWKPDRG